MAILQRVGVGGGRCVPEQPYDIRHGSLCDFSVGQELSNHGFYRDGRLRLVPDVIVRHMRHGRIAHTGLAGQKRLWDGCHADDRKAELFEDLAFSLRAETRTFDGHEDAASMHGTVGRGDSGVQISLRYVQKGSATDTWTTIPPVPALGSSKKLEKRCRVRSNNWSGMTISPGWYCGCRLPQALMEIRYSTPSRLETVDVGPAVQAGWADAVSTSMPGQKSHTLTFDRADDIHVGGGAERCVNPDFTHVAELAHVVDAAATDDASAHLLHWIRPFFFAEPGCSYQGAPGHVLTPA